MGSGGRWHGGGDCVLLPQVEALQVGISLCYFHIWSDSLSWLLVYVLRADKFWIVRKPVTNFFFILILLTIGISKCSRIVNAVERFPEKNILFQAKAWVDTIFLSWCCLFLLEIDALILPLVCVFTALSYCLEKKDIASCREPLTVCWCEVRPRSPVHALRILVSVFLSTSLE